jgi:hypothetical protein
MLGSHYQPEAWQTLYTMLGGSLAALAGLLFVAMSLHLEAIMRTPILRMRSVVNTIGVVVLFTLAGVVLVPRPPLAFGTEVVIFNLMGLMLPTWIAVRLIRAHMTPMIPKRAAVWAGIYLVGIAGGILLAFDLTAGMYLLTTHYFSNIAFFFFNSWTIMTGVDEKESLVRNT